MHTTNKNYMYTKHTTYETSTLHYIHIRILAHMSHIPIWRAVPAENTSRVGCTVFTCYQLSCPPHSHGMDH